MTAESDSGLQSWGEQDEAAARALGWHPEGNEKFGQCNIAEEHALAHPGHSVTVIQDLRTEKDQTFTVLIIACMGTPVVFMQEGDERDCTFHKEIRLP